MATIRRLSDADVRCVFESIHHNHPPPPHLPFQVVPVGTDGQKLSPPPYEFEDGLYVLLKPTKKNDVRASTPRIPSNLAHLLNSGIEKSESLTWSLSGPQFPKPTAIQQRYCYPRGENEYCGRKGGALWTMYREDGVEDTDYRLLHVYFSAKRAVNKGMKIESNDVVSNKRFKRPPPRITVSSAAARVDNRPTTPTSTASSESSFYPSPKPDNAKSSVFRRSTPVLSGSDAPRNDDDVNKSPNRCGFHPVVSEPSSPIRPRPQLSWDESLRSIDEHVFDIEPGFGDFEASLKEGLDECMKGTEDDQLQNFAKNLEKIHEVVKDMIMYQTDEENQGYLVSLFSDWAKHVSQSPLGDPDLCFSTARV